MVGEVRDLRIGSSTWGMWQEIGLIFCIDRTDPPVAERLTRRVQRPLVAVTAQAFHFVVSGHSIQCAVRVVTGRAANVIFAGRETAAEEKGRSLRRVNSGSLGSIDPSAA